MNSSFYIEPLDVSQLQEKEVYFMVDYIDKKLFIPQIRTLVFLGRDVAGKNDTLLYFQDVESYVRLGPYPNSANGTGDIFYCTDDQLACFFTLDKAVLALQNCVNRRAQNTDSMKL
jgi:hypothetical protein